MLVDRILLAVISPGRERAEPGLWLVPVELAMDADDTDDVDAEEEDEDAT